MAVDVALLRTRAFRDLGLAGDHGRDRLLRRPAYRGGDLAVIVAVDRLDGPAGRLEAQHLVAGLGDGRRAVDGGVVVVEQHGQLGELQTAGEADRLLADALHQAAVAGDDPGAVIDQVVAVAGVHRTLGHGQPDGGGDALAQRAGGDLDARGVAVLWVAGGVAAPLTEVADLVHRHGLEAGQVQQTVDQHRGVAGRQHEAVAVGPVRLVRVVAQELRPQHGGHVGQAHRGALVAGLGGVDGVHREDADGVGHLHGADGHGGAFGLSLCCADGARSHGRAFLSTRLPVASRRRL